MSLPLKQKLKGNIQLENKENLDEEDSQDWMIKIDLRAGSGFETKSDLMPSLFFEAIFSESLNLDSDSKI